MANDKEEGLGKKIVGKLKEVAGVTTNDPVEAEGKAQQVEGKGQEMVGKAEDALSDDPEKKDTSRTSAATLHWKRRRQA